MYNHRVLVQAKLKHLHQAIDNDVNYFHERKTTLEQITITHHPVSSLNYWNIVYDKKKSILFLNNKCSSNAEYKLLNCKQVEFYSQITMKAHYSSLIFLELKITKKT